jgi:hypothetical protein
MHNKAFKSGLVPDHTCPRCEAPETMEYLLNRCENYSDKIWAQVGFIMAHRRVYHCHYPHTTRNSVEQTPSIPSPSSPRRQDAGSHHSPTLRKKRDIVYRHVQLKNSRRQEELQPRIQGHLLSVVKKVMAFLECQTIL